VLLMAAVSYTILQATIISTEGPDSMLAGAVGKDRKGKLSLMLYLIAIPTALFRPWIAGTLYAIVAVIWLVPDRRIERAQAERAPRD
jgi:uncharacterized membrane protein